MTSVHDPQQPQPTWSAERRSWVSLLIFAHLFAVFVAATAYTRPSPIQEQLHELFGPYLRNLHLTAVPAHANSYPFARFHLTHDLPSDVDFTCEVSIDGKGGVENVTIPAPGLKPGIRARRYQALANAAGSLASTPNNDDFAGILPRAIAGALVKQRGATEGTVRCRTHLLKEMGDLEATTTSTGEPLDNDIYEAQVFVTSSGIELLKKSSTLEVAPVKSADGKRAGGKPADNKNNSPAGTPQQGSGVPQP